MTLTLRAIHRLALRHVPRVACLPDRLEWPLTWAPAHELAHALVATPKERTLPEFGLPCAAGFCNCPGERCHVVELAAMDVSRRLVTAAGRPDLAEEEAQATEDYDRMVCRWTLLAARRLIVRRRLQRLPRTVAGLARLLRRRLG